MAAARKAKRRLENPLTGAQKTEKVVAEVKRQRKIQWTQDDKSERGRVEAERQSAEGVGGLIAAETTRQSSRRNK